MWTGVFYDTHQIGICGIRQFQVFVPVHSQDQADFVDKADVPDKVPEPPTESDHDNVSDSMEDLAETGLLPSDAEMQGYENSDANDDQNSAITTDSRMNDFVDESMDVSQATEPGKPENTDTEDTEIADTSTENASNNPQTLTPPLQQTDLQNNEQGETLTSTSGKTDSHEDDDGYGSEDPESDDSDVILVGITVPDKPLEA